MGGVGQPFELGRIDPIRSLHMEVTSNEKLVFWLVDGRETSKPFKHEVNESCECSLCEHKHVIASLMGD
jgi:hypothetical protein